MTRAPVFGGLMEEDVEMTEGALGLKAQVARQGEVSAERPARRQAASEEKPHKEEPEYSEFLPEVSRVTEFVTRMLRTEELVPGQEVAPVKTLSGASGALEVLEELATVRSRDESTSESNEMLGSQKTNGRGK